jgi:predicted porin
MKKSLLALAVLGAFAGTASAQSSVTIYGLLDLAITKGNGGTAATGVVGSVTPGVVNTITNPGGNGTSKAYTMKQSASSRLGFRGNEDLGGGLSAQFQIEHRFNPDTGTENVAGIFWAGRTYVQLTSAAAGSVYMGREYDPAFWPAVKSDPFGWDGVGQIASLQYAGYADVGGGSSIRTANTVGYKSPNLGGLTVQAAVALGENAGAGTAAGIGRQQGFNVEYGAGPIYAGLGYLRTTEGATDGNSLFNLALHYDLGFVKPILYYARSKTNLGQNSNKVFEIAATAPIGPGKLKAAWARLDPQGDDNKVQKIAVGYDYPLSKRTNVYADFGQFKSDVDGTTNNRAYAFGIKHTF